MTDLAQPVSDGSDAVERFHVRLASIFNDILDAWYAEHPSSNAFGSEYDGVGTMPDGTYFIGRSDGADGSDDPIGFDYLYRKFRDPETRREESEYVYGTYGWMGPNDLLEEAVLLRQVIETAIDRELVSEEKLNTFEAVVSEFESEFKQVRDQYDLGDLAQLFREHDIERLRNLLATDDESGRVVWQTLFSKDEEGNRIENPIEIPVLDERAQFMLVRTDRYYHDNQTQEAKHYAYGIVVGYDDTPERFFVHRLESDPDLRDPDTVWTPDLVKEKMGFDANLHEYPTNEFPYGERIRVQGDLVLVRHDYDRELAKYQTTQYEQRRRRVFRESDFDPFETVDDVSVFSGTVRVNADSTEELKQVQETVGIDEEEVRKRQEDRDWTRLTAQRRQEIVTEILTERGFKMLCDSTEYTKRDLKRDARDDAHESFEETREQVNNVIGNHTVIIGPATEHPDRRFGGGGTQAAYSIPGDATAFILHDEHEDKHIPLKRGVYEFRFLDGHETEWWMN